MVESILKEENKIFDIKSKINEILAIIVSKIRTVRNNKFKKS